MIVKWEKDEITQLEVVIGACWSKQTAHYWVPAFLSIWEFRWEFIRQFVLIQHICAYLFTFGGAEWAKTIQFHYSLFYCPAICNSSFSVPLRSWSSEENIEDKLSASAGNPVIKSWPNSLHSFSNKCVLRVYAIWTLELMLDVLDRSPVVRSSC